MKILEVFCKNAFLLNFLFLLMAPTVKPTGSDPFMMSTLFQDFKAVLMFFSEPYLKGAKFGNESLEGELALVMPSKLVQVIENMETQVSKDSDPRMERLVTFKDRLKAGLEISEELYDLAYSVSSFVDPSKMIPTAQELQRRTIAIIHEKGGIILDSGWVKHAIALIIEDAGNGTFNLVVANTGAGVDYHFSSSDPDKVYPHLSRVWMEFKGIPEDLIFNSDTAWFFVALAMINTRSFADRLEKSIGDRPMSCYFYESLLSNFNDYLVKPDGSGHDKLVPEQQSGSCTMSCLMAAILYHSDSLEHFYWYRLTAGHVLLRQFLKRLDKGLDAEFNNVITNGFYSGGMKHLKGLMRALANQQLQYLEHKYPNEFKHAGLIGEGRSKWAAEKKDSAILRLLNDPATQNEMRQTVNLIKHVQKVISQYTIRPETTHLQLSGLSKNVQEFDFSNLTNNDLYENIKFEPESKRNVYENILDGKPALLEVKLTPFVDFREFLDTFQKVLDMPDFGSTCAYYWRFLGVFKRLHSGSGWDLIRSHSDEVELNQIMENCKLIATRLSEYLYERQLTELAVISLDEIALIGQLQLLSWNVFQALHDLKFPESGINWIELGPPQSVQSAIFRDRNGRNIMSGNLSKWGVRGFSDIGNLELFEMFMKEARLDSTENAPISYFPGPELFEIVPFCALIDSEKIPIGKILANDNLRKMFDQFMSAPIVEEYLNELKNNEKYGDAWRNLSDETAKFIIVLTGGNHNKIFGDHLRHFNDFMLLLSYLRLDVRSASIDKPKSFDNFWLKTTLAPKLLRISFEEGVPETFSLVHVFSPKKSPSSAFRDPLIFQIHANALPESVGPTDLDSWLNYIKNSRSSKLFDLDHFQKLSDHLLNIPKYNHGSYKSILLFDETKAKLIINELIRLVSITLNRLYDSKKKLNTSLRAALASRASNISVIITRFISRADYEFKDSKIDWALLLADLYNVVEPFSHLNSSILKLTESDISMLNLALSHMCYVHLRNPESFIENIELGFAYSNKRYRKTLARFHWFIAKTNYIISWPDQTIADQQFIYGFWGSPIEQSEIKFFESILKEKYLKIFYQGESDFSFRYSLSGYAVEISSPDIKILLNLATGVTMENGILITSKSEFINSDEFRSYFNADDSEYLNRESKAIDFAGVKVLVLPKLRGIDYFIVKYQESFFILREWNRNWYIWRFGSQCRDYLSLLNYAWSSKKHKIRVFKKYKRSTDLQNETELIIFDDAVADDPFIQVTKVVSLDGKHYTVSVPGRTDEINAKFMKINNLEMHLKQFAEEGVAFGKQESDNSYIIVYNKHRLPEDPTKPFVLTASKLKPTLTVRNVPNMEICEDQRIGKSGLSLPGSLVASVAGKKVLLLPFAEVLKSSTNLFPPSTGYINIESIPIVESDHGSFAIPAPQSRKHKLLLAYYMILAQDYDTARELLNPSTSIHQNEAFNQEELDVLSWISMINLKDPESETLKLVSIFHLHINKKKFAFNKDKLEYPAQTEAELMGVFTSYMMSIREVSEKYNIFKIFPEILSEGSVLFNLFFNNDLTRIYGMREKLSEKFKYPDFVYGIEKLEFGVRPSFGNLVHLMNDKNLSKTTRELINRLTIKNTHQDKLDRTIEMAIFCFNSNPSIWDDFLDVYKRTGNNIKGNVGEFNSNLQSAMLQCWNLYKKQFDGANLAEFSTSTDFNDIRETMRNDLGKSEIVGPLNKNQSVAIIDNEEIALLNRMRANILNLIRNKDVSEVNPDVGIDSVLVRSSTVLCSLFESIRSFIIRQGGCQLNDLNSKIKEDLVIIILDLRSYLERRINELEVKQGMLSEKLIDSTYPKLDELPFSNLIAGLMSTMHQRKQKTFSDLYACHLRNSLSCIQKKFPQLSSEECQQIQTNATLFYSQQIHLNFLTFLQKSTAAFVADTHSITVDNLMILCDELAKITDFNARLQDPVIMNFEFRSTKYRLKAEQVKDIDLLTGIGSDNNFKSVVIQRMMAAGKTLVLGTVSVVMKALKADDKLSVLAPPSSLYQSNTTAMQTRTYQYFKKKGDTLNFPRLPLLSDPISISNILEYLKNIISIIERTITDKNYLILSPDHLQSFLNSYIEFINGMRSIPQSDEYDEILKQFATIYKIFKERTSIIFDEIDMTMDPKKELNFPTCEMETYNMTAVAMLADIMEFLVFDERIKDAGLNIYSNNQAALTPENYEDSKNIVLDYIESQLKNKKSLWRNFVLETESENAINFLRSENISARKDWILSYANYGNREIANALIIVKVQIDFYLKGFLGGTVNQNYGSAGPLRSEIQYAVPYVAANTPSTGSCFADRWETLVKTLLMISAAPCSMETTKKVIKVVEQMLVNESTGASESEIKNSPTYVLMNAVLSEKLDPLGLNEKDSNHLKLVHNGLVRRSPAAIRILYVYYINEVFAKMEFPVEQITSNALHMASMFNSVQGYSGTIGNVNILLHKVVKAASNDHEKNEVNNGGIALKLIQDCNNAAVPQLSDEVFTLTAFEMIRKFFGTFEAMPQCSIDRVSAIIDTGALFKNFTNLQVAEAILEYFKGKIRAVLYYDETSNQLQFIRGTFESGNIVSTKTGYLETTDPDDILKATQVEIGSRFTFYDQRHITGSDILQPKSAHAIMTADPRVLLRDILQGTLRMRQFMTSQTVNLIVSKSLRKYYNSKINGIKEEIRVSDLLTLAALNEAEKQERENEKLAFAKIDAEIRAFILDEISNVISAPSVFLDKDRILYVFNNSRDLFIRSIKEDPSTWLLEQKLQDSKEVLVHHAKARLRKIKPLFASKELKSKYAALSKSIGSMIGSLLQYMRKEVTVNTNPSIGTEMLIQNQTETLTLVELELEQIIQYEEPKGKEKKYKYNLVDQCEKYSTEAPIMPLTEDFANLKLIYDSQPENYKSMVDAVLQSEGNRIGITRDLLQLYENIANYPIFSNLTREGSHLLIFGSQDGAINPYVLLISPKHAAQAYKDIQLRKEVGRINSSYFWLCDLAGDIVASTQESSVGSIFEVKEFESNIERLIFDLLIFNGSLLQILGNSKLKSIYEDEWFENVNFKDRALFLRLRMRTLMEKDNFMFEDDEEYVKLAQLSSGNRLTEEKSISHTGYPKPLPSNLELQSNLPIDEREVTSHINLIEAKNELKYLIQANQADLSDEQKDYFVSYAEDPDHMKDVTPKQYYQEQPITEVIPNPETIVHTDGDVYINLAHPVFGA